MAQRSLHDAFDRLHTDNEAGYTSVTDCPETDSHGRSVADSAGDPFGEAKVLVAIQDALFDVPGVVPAARAMSLFGEHALGWMGIGAVGAVVDPRRRRCWLGCAGVAFTAHAASVILKRVVRRPRPHDEDITIGVKTPSKLSFPSSHATSTTAALVCIASLTGARWTLVGIPAMMLSRMVLGVHYPTDVAAGAALGAGTAALCQRLR